MWSQGRESFSDPALTFPCSLIFPDHLKPAPQSTEMANTRPCLAQLSRLCLHTSKPISPYNSARYLSSTAPLSKGFKPALVSKKERTVASRTNPQKNKKKGVAETKKRKARTTYIQYDLRDADKFSLCDAMRYVSLQLEGREL